MPYDVLFISSYARKGSYLFRPESHPYLMDKYGLSQLELQRMIAGEVPVWREGGQVMSYAAAENWARSGGPRRVEPAPAPVVQEHVSVDNTQRVKFGNGIYVTDHLVKQGLQVELINDLGVEWEIFKDCLARGPRVVALSTTFISSREIAEDVARLIRAEDPDVFIVVGGPLVHYSHRILQEAPHHLKHPQAVSTFFFTEAEPDPDIDAVIIEARGERTLAELVQRLKDGRPWQDVPNLGFLDTKRQWVFTPRVHEEMGVDEEKVAWDTLDEKFLGGDVAVRGSRGCPLRCKFCSFIVIHPDLVVKDVDVLRAELRRIAQRKGIIKHVYFVDDNLFLTRESVDEYCRMMAEEKFPFTWSAFMRVDSVSEQNIKWIVESGCTHVMLGVESGDWDVLRNMGKPQKPAKMLKSLGILSDHGVSALSTFVVGFPGETEETVGNTIDFLNSYPDHGKAVHWFVPYLMGVVPLTGVDRERDKWNLIGVLLDWEHDTMNVAEAFRQRDRMLREVRRGGCHPALGLVDDHWFTARGEAGERDMRKFYRLRHRVACLDHWNMPEMDGVDRNRTIEELQTVVITNRLENLVVRDEAFTARLRGFRAAAESAAADLDSSWRELRAAAPAAVGGDETAAIAYGEYLFFWAQWLVKRHADLALARELFEDVLQVCRHHTPDDHARLWFVYRWLARVALEEGRQDEALDYADQGLSSCLAAYGPEHHWTEDARTLREKCAPGPLVS